MEFALTLNGNETTVTATLVCQLPGGTETRSEWDVAEGSPEMKALTDFLFARMLGLIGA